MGVCYCSMFCCMLLCVHFSIAIILVGKRGLVALFGLSSWCLVVVGRLFLAVPQGCLQFVIVAFPDHTHLLFLASGLSTCDFSTLYTTLPHNLIKEKLTELIEQTFNREGSLYLACNDKYSFFTSEQPKRYKLWSCQKMCDALHYFLDNIFIRFGSKL